MIIHLVCSDTSHTYLHWQPVARGTWPSETEDIRQAIGRDRHQTTGATERIPSAQRAGTRIKRKSRRNDETKHERVAWQNMMRQVVSWFDWLKKISLGFVLYITSQGGQYLPILPRTVSTHALQGTSNAWPELQVCSLSWFGFFQTQKLLDHERQRTSANRKQWILNMPWTFTTKMFVDHPTNPTSKRDWPKYCYGIPVAFPQLTTCSWKASFRFRGSWSGPNPQDTCIGLRSESFLEASLKEID